MNDFMSASVIWIILGFILFILEFLIPGLILFFFALGAWIVAFLLLFLDLSINMQLITFVISSVITIVLLRKWVSQLLWKRKNSTEILEDEFLGKTGMAETDISPSTNGKITFKGTSWQASSSDIIEAGENVTIIGNESILLIVKSTKTI